LIELVAPGRNWSKGLGESVQVLGPWLSRLSGPRMPLRLIYCCSREHIPNRNIREDSVALGLICRLIAGNHQPSEPLPERLTKQKAPCCFRGLISMPCKANNRSQWRITVTAAPKSTTDQLRSGVFPSPGLSTMLTPSAGGPSTNASSPLV